jgi:hypothetical protein
MTRISLTAALLLPVFSAPAAAADLIWHLYAAEAGGTLAVMEQSELESPEPYWPLALQCNPGENWTMTVAGIDGKLLGAAISAGEPPMFSFIVDGEDAGHGLGGYSPTIAFSEMFGEWEYSVPISLDTIRSFSDIATLAITGTGLDMKLPTDGLDAAINKFIAICAPLQQPPG